MLRAKQLCSSDLFSPCWWLASWCWPVSLAVCGPCACVAAWHTPLVATPNACAVTAVPAALPAPPRRRRAGQLDFYSWSENTWAFPAGLAGGSYGFDNVIAVASIAPNGALSSFSNYGSNGEQPYCMHWLEIGCVVHCRPAR